MAQPFSIILKSSRLLSTPEKKKAERFTNTEEDFLDQLRIYLASRNFLAAHMMAPTLDNFLCHVAEKRRQQLLIPSRISRSAIETKNWHQTLKPLLCQVRYMMPGSVILISYQLLDFPLF